MKLQPQVSKKSSTNPDTSIHKSSHKRPLNTQSVKNSLAPLIQQKRENQQYQQDSFEAAKLQIQAKYGNITAEGQEQLAFLQAKKAAFWQQHLRNTRFYNQGCSQVPVHCTDVSLQAIQTKLTIGAPGDKYEKEADRVAASVVKQINAPVSGQFNQNIQREGMPEEDKLMMAPHISNIQRETMPEEEELQTKPQLQLQAGDGSTTANSELESSIQQARGGGQPLADNIRKPMEQAFGANFSGVKVHTDSQADRLNQSIQAKAFTTGQDVFFRQGAYEPGSRGGQELIAHELTHVLQQSGGVIGGTSQLQYRLQHPGTKPLKVVQRVVDVQGEKNPSTLWENVRNLVEKVYRRRKTLFQKCSETNTYYFSDYQHLADELDSENQTKSNQGRTRPNWAPGITKFFTQTWGGKRHRRHIIMSSLMRDAVYSVTDKNSFDQGSVLKVYNNIISVVGFSGYNNSNLEQAEAALVYVLHNNPANLILDMGVENSAIGALAHNVDVYLQKDDKDLALDFAKYSQDKTSFLTSLVHGFEPQKQAEIIKTITTDFPLPTKLDKFREFLEMIYDNNAFDLMTKQGMPDYTSELTDLHGRFIAARDKGDLHILNGIGHTFVNIGLRFSSCPYSSIW